MTIPKLIVTHGRAGQVATFEWLPNAALCVAASQEPLYREHYPDAEYIVHPDDVVGLHAKRNWVSQTLGTVWMVDDDVVALQSLWHATGSPVKPKGQYAEDLIDRLHDEAEDAGAFLFCFAHNANPVTYAGLAPFRLTGIVRGQAFGIRAGSKLSWSTAVRVQGDLWIGLLNAHHHRMVWVDERWGTATTAMFAGTGVHAGERSDARVAADNEIIRQTFGRDLIRKQRRSHLFGKVGHSGQMAMHLPF